MTYNTDDADGWQSLHVNQLLDRWQYSVASGCAVSINSGTLGQADTLSIASGEVVFNGGAVSVSAQSAQIDASNPADPRKDVVYIDGTGTVQVANGTAEAAEPSGSTRFETYRPAPLDLSGTQAVVLAEVWVPAGASSITGSDVRDRRVDADAALNSLAGLSANDLVDVEGTNLSVDGSGVLNASGGGLTTAVISSADSPYTTSDEDVIYANTSGGAVTVTLASADVADGNEIRVVNVDGSNAVTVDTEGTETIDPGAASSKSITEAGWGVTFVSDGSNWDADAAAEYESVNGGGPVSDGDGTERQIWVIANGASDPAGAGVGDIIFEEEA